MDKPRYYCTRGFLNGSDGKKSVCNAGDPSSIPGLGRYPGERNGNRTSVLARKVSWTESLVGYSLWGHKQVQLRDLLYFHFQVK